MLSIYCVMFNVLRDFFEKRLIYDNIGKDTHFSMRRFTKFMQNFYKNFEENAYM